MTLAFETYVQNVLPNEWPGYWSTKTNAIQAFRAGAIAVKSYAWRKEQGAAYGTWNGQCYDVDDSINTQRYVPGSSTTMTNQAVVDTWNVVAHTSSGSLISGSYASGASGDPCAYWNGRMNQYATLTCAAAGEGYQQIVTTFYKGTVFSTATGVNHAPIGSLDSAVPAPTEIEVGGWAYDSDTTAAINVDVYVDGTNRARTLADLYRPDVPYGAYHGYDVGIGGIAAGPHTVCTYGIDSAGGTNPQLGGCKSVTVLSGNPFGSFDTATVGAGHTVALRGWAIDPDTTAAINVDIWYDSMTKYGGRFVANATRTDVGAVYPGYGSGHGYAVTLTLPAGTHTLCAFGINFGAGTTNPQLGSCKTITA